MKLGEIKIEALKLMFAGDGFDYSVEDLESLKTDDNYKFYLSAMNGSINRCFSVFEQEMVLDTKSATLLLSQGTTEGNKISFNLKTLVTDIYKILKIEKKNCFGGFEQINYEISSNNLEVSKFNENESLVISYKPAISKISASNNETDEINLPEDIVSLVPYFVKGELYLNDEPSLAVASMDWFLERLNNLHNWSQTMDNIETKYSQTEL